MLLGEGQGIENARFAQKKRFSEERSCSNHGNTKKRNFQGQVVLDKYLKFNCQKIMIFRWSKISVSEQKTNVRWNFEVKLPEP